jgi:hypothetical protein
MLISAPLAALGPGRRLRRLRDDNFAARTSSYGWRDFEQFRLLLGYRD